MNNRDKNGGIMEDAAAFMNAWTVQNTDQDRITVPACS